MMNGKSAWVTGGGSGIGEAAARRLARAGARVSVADLNEPAARRVAGEIRASGGQARAVAFDVTSESAWETGIQKHLQEWGGLDILVNSAGISAAGPVADTPLEVWRRIHAVNLDGVFLGTRAGIWTMRRRGGGVIVNIASVAGMNVYPGTAAYASSKAAVVHLSKVAAEECWAAGEQVRVHVLAPGGVRTPMWKTLPMWKDLSSGGEEAAWNKLDPGKVFYSPDEIAESILELVLRPTSPSVLVLDRATRP